jgi:hypothetical protein
VTAVKINLMQPSALLAACAQVSEWPSFVAAPAAHAPVGYGAVAAVAVEDTTLSVLTRPRVTQLQGTSGFAVKVNVIGTDPVGGVRGIPPRGWPV